MPKIEGSHPIQTQEIPPFSSVQGASLGFSTVSTIWSYATHPFWIAVDKVKSFFSWIFSWFSSKSSHSVQEKSKLEKLNEAKGEDQIRLKRIPGEGGKFAIQLMVKGTLSDNKLFFEKNQQSLIYLGKEFKDSALNKFVGRICQTVMTCEKVTKISARPLVAIDLCLTGIELDDEIAYQPDVANQQNNTIKGLLQKANERKKTLTPEENQALLRIEDRLTKAPSSENKSHTPYFSLPINDLFILRNALEQKKELQAEPRSEYAVEKTALGDFEILE